MYVGGVRHFSHAGATGAAAVGGAASWDGWLPLSFLGIRQTIVRSWQDLILNLGRASHEIHKGIFPHLWADHGHPASSFEEDAAEGEPVNKGSCFCFPGSCPCCFTSRFDSMAEAANQAYLELNKADHALGVVAHSEMKNTKPVIRASEEVDDALEVLHPLVEYKPSDELTVEGPVRTPEVDSVQSSEQADSIAFNRAHGRPSEDYWGDNEAPGSMGTMPPPCLAVVWASAPSAGRLLQRSGARRPRSQKWGQDHQFARYQTSQANDGGVSDGCGRRRALSPGPLEDARSQIIDFF